VLQCQDNTTVTCAHPSSCNHGYSSVLILEGNLIIRVHAIKLLVCQNRVDQYKMVTLQLFSGLLCLVVLYSFACEQGTPHCDSSVDHPPSNCSRTTFTLLLLLGRLVRASLRLQLLQVSYQFVAFQQLGIQGGYQLIVLLKLHTHFLHLQVQCRWHIILAGQTQFGAAYKGFSCTGCSWYTDLNH